MKETDLAKPIISWLLQQHWDVYQEVQFFFGGGVADIVAVRNNIIWIIECKTSYSFHLLEQATNWPVHYRSIAIPWARTPRDFRVAKNYYSVGVIEVNQENVREIISAPLFIRNFEKTKRYISSLTELQKSYAPAGSPSGNHLTPYKQTMLEVQKLIKDNPGCTVRFLYEQLGKMHYSSTASFKGNLIKALERFEPWCRIDFNSKPYKLFALDK